ncbi:MAG: 2Fe-2S iron-sulfur cluster binding domain-containing protein [Proteobacteria bacterium]|jgi:ferredoxin, 2Fe-2S|nr:2Fe-2S iron-sulfur cluster binding domain-containing protein [Pseudomonadota bacterium]
MALIKYIQHDGTEHEADVAEGSSVMQGAVDNGIDGILAECGGACSCATCHVYVDEAWKGKIPDADDMEKAMVECVLEPKDSSRLSCQITVTAELDGLVVQLPESQ